MALGEPERTPLEIWMDRFWRGVYCFFTTVAYLTLFGLVMVPNRAIGLIIAPFVAILYWRVISYWIVGEQFKVTFTTAPADTQEMFSVIFSVLYGLNLIVFIYHLVTWYEIAPKA